MASKPKVELQGIDILQMELTKNLPHWLSPQEKDKTAPRREAIRKKHRDKYLAEQRAKHGVK